MMEVRGNFVGRGIMHCVDFTNGEVAEYNDQRLNYCYIKMISIRKLKFKK
jgi:hypothetical protein